MSDFPKISVVVPAYNAGLYIEETLYSVFHQTVKPYEVIVVDDCSTDRTYSKALAFNYFSRGIDMRVVKNVENLGIGGTRQHGAYLASGDYVAYLSSDDCWHPSFLENLCPFLDKNTGVFSDYYVCDEILTPKEVFRAPEPTHQNILDYALRKNMFINFSANVIPRAIFESVKFEISLRHGEDLIFLLDTVIHGLEWKHVAEPLTYYRVHSMQGTQTAKYVRKEFDALWYALFARLIALEVSPLAIDQYRSRSVQVVLSSLLQEIL